MQNKSNRNLYIDIVKGIAIILVVYGHCIEYYSTEYLNGNFFYSDLIHNLNSAALFFAIYFYILT